MLLQQDTSIVIYLDQITKLKPIWLHCFTLEAWSIATADTGLNVMAFADEWPVYVLHYG